MDFSTYFYTNSEFLFPEIFLSLSFIGLIFYGGIALYEPWLLTRYMNKISLCVTGILILLILNSSFSSQSFLSISFFQDLSTLWVKLFLFVSVFCCFILFENSTHQFFEFSILILLSLFGTILLIMSFDLISLYLAIELQSLCFYILASLKKNSAYSTEAGLKYFILGALTSGLLLFGCSLIYGAIGTTNFEHFTNLFINFNDHSPLLIIGSLFILIAIFFKLAAAPFHNWSPDVYEGAPTTVTMFFAIVPKIGIFFVLCKFLSYIFYDFTELISWWSFFGGICSICSIFIGSIMGLQQNRLKRLLAYSAIGHVGFMLIGIFSNNIESLQSVFFYLIIYNLTSICTWGSLLGIFEKKNISEIKFITELKTIYFLHPLLCFTFIISFFSLAGIPPLAGFLAKFSIFLTAMKSNFFLILISSIVFSTISTFYYLRVIKSMIFEKTLLWNNKIVFSSVKKLPSILLSFSFLNLFILFFFPNFLYLLTYYFSLLCF